MASGEAKREREAANGATDEEREAKKPRIEGEVAAENVEQQPKADDNAVEVEAQKINGADEAEKMEVDAGAAKEDPEAQKVDAGTEVAADDGTEKEAEGDGKAEGNKRQVVNKEVQLGPMTFQNSNEMFSYFTDIVHQWPENVDLNKYEYLVFMALLEKGHSDPKTKIGVGVAAFQVRNHPEYRSRCLYLIREDGSVDDFSARKCIENLMGLPHSNNHGFGKPGGGGRGGGRGRGRGGRGRGGFRGRGGRGGGRGGRGGRGRD